MAARVTDTFKNRHEYVPPSVQKSINQHMDRMPPHLKKYQEAGSYIPVHEERAMAQHLKQSLPSHLKKYGDAYVQQTVARTSLSRPGSTTPAPASSAPANSLRRQNFSGNNYAASQKDENKAPQNGPPPNEYDFILNPESQRNSSLSMFLTGGSKLQKTIIFVGGGIMLILLAVMASSFLNRSANAHNEKLLELAKTQTEIVRVIDEADDKITDQNVRNFSVTTKLSVISTKGQVVASLGSYGKKVKDKDLKVANPDNDKVLSEGEQNGRFDETFKQLIEQQLSDYQKQLKAVYDSGNSTEKEFTVSANEQVNLLLRDKQAST